MSMLPAGMVPGERNFQNWKEPKEDDVVKVFNLFDLDGSGDIDTVRSAHSHPRPAYAQPTPEGRLHTHTHTHTHTSQPNPPQLHNCFLSSLTSTPPLRSQHEIKMALRRFWGIELTAAEAQSIMTIYDADGNNTLDIDEFRCMLKNVSTAEREASNAGGGRGFAFPAYTDI